MPDYYKAPQFAARFREEQEDFDRLQQVPREAMDNEYNRVLRGADAGPLSQGSRRTQAQERNAIYGMRDEANRMTSKANAFKRNLSDRDLQWQNMQADREFRQRLMEREMANQEGETRYRRERDAKMDSRAEKEAQITAAERMTRSSDPATRVKGEIALERLLEGNAGGNVSRGGGSFTQQAQEGLVGPQVGPMAGGSQAQDPRITMAMKEREAQMRAAEEERAMKREQQAYDMANRRAMDAESRQEKQRRTKLDFLKAALAETQDPTERARLMNEGAAVAAELAPLVNEPRGGMGISRVGDMLKSAWSKVDEAGQTAARNTFKVDALKQKRYDAEQKRAGLGLDRAPNVDMDEDFNTDKAILRERVKQLTDTGFGNANADPAAVKALASEIESIAAKNAERLGGTPAQFKSNLIRDVLATPGLPDGVRKQLLAMLTGGEVGGRERSAVGKAMDVTTGMPLTPQWVVRKMLGQ